MTILARLSEYSIRFFACALRVGPLRWFWQALADLYRQASAVAAEAPITDIPEISPIVPRQEDGPALRLNLLVPSVSKKHVFGGIQTALLVIEVLRENFEHVRIITTDDATADCTFGAYYASWPIVGMEEKPPTGDHIVTAGSRYGCSLAVGANDIFLATAWWTAYNGFALIDWQAKVFPEAKGRRLLYLIQDFEPGFYPWSSRYALAEATYRRPDDTVAIINSQLLADYLAQHGYNFPMASVLQPRLNPDLAKIRSSGECFIKERILLVYGRPGVERNAFGLLVAALRQWVETYPAAVDWQILSAGESFPEIDLGRKCVLRCVGKLDLTSYASILKRTAVGVSLMVSPHPSYPPLELAAFGARVITNRFANKDLQEVSSFISTVAPLSPALLACSIVKATGDFDALSEEQRIVWRAQIDNHDGFLAVDRWADVWPSQVLASVRTFVPRSAMRYLSQ